MSGARLTAEQLTTLGQALGDAVSYRSEEIQDGSCPDCGGGLCESHAWESARVDAYLELAEALGMQL